MWWINTPELRREISARQAGTTRKRISRKNLATIEFPVPPLNEQRRIVAAIEEHLSRLDAANESLTQAGLRLDQLRTTVLSEPFDGEWPLQPLAEVNDPERPVRYGILMPKEHIDDGVLYVRVKDYPKGRIEIGGLKRTSHEIAAKYKRATLQSGDVLLAIRGTYGRVAIVPPELDGGNITQDTARIAPLPHLDARFVAGYLRSAEAQRYFQRVARGVAVKGVNIGDLRVMPIPIPPLEEQRRIVAEVEARLGAIDALRAAVERAQRRGAALRRLILERAFRGELVPQDPSDEPASVLLDRIRAERDRAGRGNRRARSRMQG
jgi:type I restriction enzyme S subunit